MGQPLHPTTIAFPEALFDWVGTALAAVAISAAPLLFVFRSATRRAEWRRRYAGELPWLAVGARAAAYVALALVWVISMAASYWISRGGHTFRHRVVPAVLYGATLALVAVWSWPALVYAHAACTLLAAAAEGAAIAYTVFVFIAQPWEAGAAATVSCVALFGMLLCWRRVPTADEAEDVRDVLVINR